ncbi:CBS domain-containing protein [Bradyrhizobium sp. CB3481]|uniref:CBS domain-containing protein n=1 Tax=Bradyrhizobium sp. CB3481 TaxID=3039158 RepID=UPI0024B1113D|nr:CBS domain-containing protein [Bradyrhizobium sp. CB3481]WFU14823.1 CBS domain-containing protein [Bradyrhizobium sp. CB3481]
MHSFLEQIVADHMTSTPKVVTRDLTLRELCDLFQRDDFNTYPVEDRSQVIGVVSKLDVLSRFVFTPARIMPRHDDLMNLTAIDVMTPEFIYVGRETKLTRVLELIVNHRIRSMPVIETGQRLAGIISRSDVLRALQRCSHGA